MDSPSTHRLLALAHELIEEARSHDCVLRLTGSLAVRQRCTTPGVLDVLEREPPADIDLFAYWKDVDAIERQLSARDWVPDPALAQGREFGVQRLIFHTREEHAKVEVFFDELKMSHTIDLRGRLEREHLTIGLAELLLSKLQIHELTSKDVKDAIAILATHDLAADGADLEQIDEARVVEALSGDWGLWYTSLANIDAVDAALADVPRLAPEHVARVRQALDRLRRAAHESPKPLRWRMRAKIGPRTRWYTEVDEVDRGTE